MVSALEGATAPSSLAAELDVGVAALSLNQVVTFCEYKKFVLPVDGFVFWFNTGNSFDRAGSLHYSANQNQEEDGTLGVNQVVFTTAQEIVNFNCVNPNQLYLASLPDGTQFAFSQRGRYYAPANLYHYVGTAVLSPFKSQIVANPLLFDKTSQVVSDSLPFWLALNSYVPPYPGFQFPTGFMLYPSFAVPNNLIPPYGVVHVEPASIEGVQGAPYLDTNLSPWQLTEEEVKLTMYGLRNADALTVRDTVFQYSYDYNNFGIVNTPVLRDEKRTQVEMATLAMKKTMSVRVSYNQYTAREVARQEIEKAVNSYYPQPLTAVGFVPPAP